MCNILRRKGVLQLLKYVVKRVFLAIITLLIICAITFFAMNAIPGGPFDGEKAISEEVRAALERRYNPVSYTHLHGSWKR